jgi:hypothetical protein
MNQAGDVRVQVLSPEAGLIDEVEVAQFIAWKDTAETAEQKERKKASRERKDALVSSLSSRCKCAPTWTGQVSWFALLLLLLYGIAALREHVHASGACACNTVQLASCVAIPG